MHSLAAKQKSFPSTSFGLRERETRTKLPMRNPSSRPGAEINAASKSSEPHPVFTHGLLNIQPKLEIGAPGDAAEQEADRIAEQVMRRPEPAANSESCGGRGEHAMASVSGVQTKSAGAGSGSGIDAPPIVHEVLNSPGRPLDDATRAFMEPRFGRDFSGVRVHTDGLAATAADSINARAFTAGNHIAFQRGEYNPASSSGKIILAHELTHTIQQGANSSQPTVQRLQSAKDKPPKEDLVDLPSDVHDVTLSTVNAAQIRSLVGDVLSARSRNNSLKDEAHFLENVKDVFRQGGGVAVGYLDEQGVAVVNDVISVEIYMHYDLNTLREIKSTSPINKVSQSTEVGTTESKTEGLAIEGGQKPKVKLSNEEMRSGTVSTKRQRDGSTYNYTYNCDFVIFVSITHIAKGPIDVFFGNSGDAGLLKSLTSRGSFQSPNRIRKKSE